jgi:hypothetical protein
MIKSKENIYMLEERGGKKLLNFERPSTSYIRHFEVTLESKWFDSSTRGSSK